MTTNGETVSRTITVISIARRGDKAHVGSVRSTEVDPAVIPIRTRLYVEGYGYCVAGDIGSAIKGDRIDLGFHNRAAALRFGRRPVTVRVLD